MLFMDKNNILIVLPVPDSPVYTGIHFKGLSIFSYPITLRQPQFAMHV